MTTILSLPVELQTYILSFLILEFYDFIPASQVCRLWETILLGPQFQKIRYLNKPISKRGEVFGIHRYFRSYWGMFIRLGCHIDKQKGTITEYFIELESYHLRASKDYFGEYKDTVKIDISQSPFLNEPFFSPFVDMEAVGVELAARAPLAIRRRVYRHANELMIRESKLRAFVEMKERFRVRILVSASDGAAEHCETELHYSATEHATVRQVIEGIWTKLWPMVRESVVDSVAPLEVDFNVAYSQTADIHVNLTSSDHKFSKDRA